MTDPFAAPAAASGGIDLKAVNGSLLLITVQSQETGVQTVHGLADPVKANVVVLDGPTKGEEHEDVLIFPRVLISQLKGRVGQKVLGRLGQGVAKPGQSAPWTLAEATDADKAVGVAYLAGAISTPAGNAPPF